MYCEKCGQQLADDAKFCSGCGQKVEEVNEEEMDDFKPSERKNKKNNIYLLLSGIVIVLLALVFLWWLVSKDEGVVKEHKDYIKTADKYVEDLDYEKAEDTYLNAIEIAPKEREPYLKLAKIYMEQGKYDKAEEILERADAAGAEGTIEQEAEEEQIKEQIKEEKEPQNYEWAVEPTIDADDIYYLADYPDYGAPLNNVCKQADNSRAVIQREDQYGIINLNGELLADVEYKSIYNFGENYMMRKTIPEYEEEFGCEWEVYWLNKDGTVQPDVGNGEVSLTYYYYHEGKVHTAGYIDENSTETMPVQKSEETADEDSSAESFLDNLNGKYAIEDEGKLVTDFIYDECGSESEGLLAVCQDGKWGYVDKQGNIVIPIEYDASWDKYPVLDSNYSRSTECVKDYCYAASDGYVVLKKDSEWELRDTEGQLVIEPGFFEEMRPVFDKKCWVKKDGKWGVIELITPEPEDSEEDKDVNEKVVGEYAEILYSYITGDGSYTDYKFALAYVDTDDIPELLVFQGDYHASMVEIYSFYDGEACSVGEFGSNGCVTFASKQNLISSFYSGQGNVCYDYYLIQDGTTFLTKSISYTDYDIETEKEAYKIDEKRVPEEEYNQVFNQYQNEHNWTEASWYNDGFEINETNIERMKSEYEMFAI